MVISARTKAVLRRINRAVALLAAGAWAMAAYVSYAYPQMEAPLRDICTCLWVVLILANLSYGNPDRKQVDLPPRWSGVIVVVLTGCAAIASVVIWFGPSAYLAAGWLGLGTIVVAALVWRFATDHADEIGEARFPATSDRPGGAA